MHTFNVPSYPNRPIKQPISAHTVQNLVIEGPYIVTETSHCKPQKFLSYNYSRPDALEERGEHDILKPTSTTLDFMLRLLFSSVLSEYGYMDVEYGCFEKS